MGIMEERTTEVAQAFQHVVRGCDPEATLQFATVLVRVFAIREDSVTLDQVATKEQLAETNNRFDSLEETVNKRFEELVKFTGQRIEDVIEFANRRFDDVNLRFDDVNKRFEEQTASFNRRFEEQTASFNRRFEDFNRRFEDFNRRFEEQTANFNQRFEEQAANTNRRFEEQLTNTNQRFSDMHRRLTQMMWMVGLLVGSINVFIILSTFL
ncbi:MAG: hypothetical protein EA427_14280 [Spirochaetaceae bacterium]|nr:MAG: hypothetical protein EA427_14280 [Spirochaetaceae bacterium]